MNSKKGLEGPLWILIIAIALIVFLLIYLGVFGKLFGQGARDIGDRITIVGQGDADDDGILDAVDKCPDNPRNDCEPTAQTKQPTTK